MAACTWAGSQQPDSAPAQTHYVVFMSAWLTRVGWDWERVGGGGGGRGSIGFDELSKGMCRRLEFTSGTSSLG